MPAAKKSAAKKKTPVAYVVANDTFFVGRRVMVEVGQIYESTDDLAKRYPGKFDPIEAATANPGEARNVAIPKS